ncbi:MAG: response regulator [Candidatus Desulfaltia sp.]|nr:response regulator [Candidatus Desulfaltia sp.]
MTRPLDNSTNQLLDQSTTRQLGNSTILVVEDNKDLSFMICETLRSYIGCTVISAHNGEECLKIVKKEPPDVILLDIHMPKMDGFEVCTILKEDKQTKHIPIIFLTATASDLKSRIRGLEMGADDYIVQPVDNLEMITRVKVMLRIKQLIDRTGETGIAGSLLSAKTAHNLRSPLTSIIGMADLIQNQFYGALNEKQKEFARIISKSSQQLLKMINDLGTAKNQH